MISTTTLMALNTTARVEAGADFFPSAISPESYAEIQLLSTSRVTTAENTCPSIIAASLRTMPPRDL